MDPAGSVEGFLEVGDGRVWYRRYGEPGSRPPLLCLHGGPGMPHDYLEPLAALADERPVIFYDQLGCGRSPVGATAPRWTVARFQTELERVRAGLGLAETHLFGNSWGGMLAMSHALQGATGIRSLILSSAPASVSRWLADASTLREQLPETVRATLSSHERSGWFACPEYQGAVAEYYRRHLCRLDPWPAALERTMAGLGSAPYQEMWGPSEFGPVTGELRDWELLGSLGRIRVPTLVTGGRFDEATPGHMAAVAAAIPLASLEIFEGSSHTAFLEEPEAYLLRLRSFLRQVE